MKIAIIDDGVCVNDDIDILYPKYLKHFKVENAQVMEDSWEPGITATTHGTICFGIFSHYLNRDDYELYSLKALDLENSKGTIHDLETALRWCDGQQFDIICMSIGTASFDGFCLEPLLKKLERQGTVLIAACNNKNTYTFPASSKSVLGVRRDLRGVLADREFIYNDKDISDIELTVELDLKELAQRIHYPLDEYREANSFMVPYMAAVIFGILEKKKLMLSEVRKKLQQSSKTQNKILLMEYMKKLYVNWHDDMEVPVIAIYDKCLEKNFNKLDTFILELCEKFQKEGYKAVGLLDIQESSYFYIYDMKKVHSIAPCFKDALILLDNSSMADIIFIPATKELLYEHKNNIDAVITNDKEILKDFENIVMEERVEIQYKHILEKMG